MTDLYTKAGTADECIKNLSDNPEAQALFAAEIAYCRGEIDKVIQHANEFLHSRSGFYAVNAGGMLLALAAMWKGDIALYRQAKIHICDAPWKTAEESCEYTYTYVADNTHIGACDNCLEEVTQNCIIDYITGECKSCKEFIAVAKYESSLGKDIIII